MDVYLVNGLPTHPLFVHGAVVLVPLTALALVVCAAWPGAARRLSWVLPLLGLMTLALVLATVETGEWLEEHVRETALVKEHAGMGEDLTPWTIALLVLTVVVWWVGRLAARRTVGPGEPGAGAGAAARVASLPVRIVVLVLSVLVAAGAVAQAYRLGESGAKSVWHGNVRPGGGGERE